MSTVGLLGDDSFFYLPFDLVRVGRVLLSCDLAKLQGLFDLEILVPGDIGWEPQNGDCNIINAFVLREVLRIETDGYELQDVSTEQLKNAIRFLVQHGIDINYHQEGDVTTVAQIVSYCTPIEVALYIGDFNMMDFLSSLGANPPRPLPILEAQVKVRALYNSKPQLNQFIASKISTYLGGRSRQRLRKTRKVRKSRK